MGANQVRVFSTQAKMFWIKLIRGGLNIGDADRQKKEKGGNIRLKSVSGTYATSVWSRTRRREVAMRNQSWLHPSKWEGALHARQTEASAEKSKMMDHDGDD